MAGYCTTPSDAVSLIQEIRSASPESHEKTSVSCHCERSKAISWPISPSRSPWRAGKPVLRSAVCRPRSTYRPLSIAPLPSAIPIRLFVPLYSLTVTPTVHRPIALCCPPSLFVYSFPYSLTVTPPSIVQSCSAVRHPHSFIRSPIFV